MELFADLVDGPLLFALRVMSKEIRLQKDDETYANLVRQAAGGHIAPDRYARQLQTADLARPRFTAAAKAFADEHGTAFAAEFGTGSTSTAA
ncbi:hypothetical protein [Streptomyces sp. BA2]|uniref:hypothetical protein n=1 Tax=Streptomyces sp. BA2 TaxID=436595 RepID=UPI00132AFA36|nr:hypothetical protein [Streptomyces sp. BA2]MWA16057.1 hypothetical protein [Streptomyces sp. BA2]